jgi:anaerobic magnesium-protoporphyrin IX monomethyl ester cyclase
MTSTAKNTTTRVLLANQGFTRDLGDGLERYMLGAGMRYPWSLLKRPGDRPRYAMFPLFMAYAAAVLEQGGFEVRVIDGVPLNLREGEFLARVRESAPDVIFFEPNAAMIDDTLRLMKKLRETVPATLVLGGTHVTATAQQVIEGHAFVDYIVIGEYEISLLRLIECLRDGGPIASLRGIAYRDERGKAVINERSEAIAPLDDLPIPARHLFPAYFDTDMGVYRDGFNQHSPSFHMHTSRGCPFKCNFCDRIHVLFADNRQRFFSPARVVKEMLHVKAAGAREVYFDDDNFTSNKAHVMALCDEIVHSGVDIPWSAMCDAIVLTPDLLKKMADSGCIGIKFGLDSADTRVLKTIHKPLKLENLERIVETAKTLGIKTHASVVLGLSGETKQTLHGTFAYVCALDIDSIQFSLATPLPGTPMYRDLVLAGDLTASGWAEFDGANHTVVRYRDISKEDIEAFMAQAHSMWLRTKCKRPKWVLRQVRFTMRGARSRGLGGVWGRFRRALQLVRGDAREINHAGQPVIMRF